MQETAQFRMEDGFVLTDIATEPVAEWTGELVAEATDSGEQHLPARNLLSLRGQ